MKKFLTFGLALSLSFAAAEILNIDKSHSSVNFQVTHMMISDVEGKFDDFKGEVDFDLQSKTLKGIEGEVKISSINTNNNSRDNHLKAPDFFDAAKFDKATFKATKITKDKVIADVTMHGVTKSVTFKSTIKGPVENLMSKKQMISLKLESKINRKDFGIGKKKKNAMVSDEVAIRILIEANAK